MLRVFYFGYVEDQLDENWCINRIANGLKSDCMMQRSQSV